MRRSAASFGDFQCAHCHIIVSSAHFLSGVNNRNHCPYCLWSCHLDLYAAGDRLCACKGQMMPVGLTMKNGRNKYRLDNRGELMLVHECIDCGAFSINRIAADDDPDSLIAVFEASFESQIHNRCAGFGIQILSQNDANALHKQLFGNGMIHHQAW